MTLIDLGEARHDSPAPMVPLNRPRIVRTALALLSVAGLLVLTGAAPPPPATVRPLWNVEFSSGQDDTFAVGTDAVYINKIDDQGRPTLTAYDLATGASRWRWPVGDKLSYFGPRPAGDTVLAPVDPIQYEHDDAGGNRYFFTSVRRTVVLDATSGGELWQADGDARPDAASGTVLVARHDDAVRTVELSLRRLRDGGEIWRQPLAAGGDWAIVTKDGRPSTVVTITMDGQVNAYGYADGKLRAGHRLPAGQITRNGGVYAYGGTITVVRDETEGSWATTVLDPADLRPRWTTDYASPCGRLLCTAGPTGVVAHDPATGAEVWTAAGWPNVYSLTDDRVVLTNASDPPANQLADANTGKLIGGPSPAEFTDLDDVGDSVLVVKPSKKPVGLLVLERLDLADGRTTVLGTTGPTDGSAVCKAPPGYLVCPSASVLQVTAVG